MDYETNRTPVLIVAYDYPPASLNVGRVRPSKFVKYLPEFGWQPMVLTLRPLTAQQKFTDISYAREWPHPLKVYYRFQERRAKSSGRAEQFAAKMSTPHAVAMSPKLGFPDLKRWLLDFLCVPDQEFGWFIPAVTKGVEIIRRRKIRHLITTAPPWTAQLVGLALKRLTGVRWIADYRDPWSLQHKYVLTRNRITDAIEARLICAAITHADVVLSVTPPMTERYRKEYPNLDPAKFVTLTNGFDPLDFVGLPLHRSSSGPIAFSYLGEFYDGRSPLPFLSALKNIFDEQLIQRHEIRVKFIGNVAVAEGRSVFKMIKDLGLQDIVTIGSQISRSQALELTLRSHVLLVLTEQQSHALPFKFYEALGSGGIILNIGCGGAVADVLSQTRRGIAVNHKNLKEIQNGILECITRARSEAWPAQPWEGAEIQPFNFRALTGHLAHVLAGDVRETLGINHSR